MDEMVRLTRVVHACLSDYESVELTRAAVDRYIGDRNEYFRQHPKRAGLEIWGKERVVSAFSDGQNCKDPRW
jgi:hypothetical protein